MSDKKEKAELSKQKGNEAFKKGDYANAVGFYTAAMMENPSDVTYPLNRAAAYLKLGKHLDAERDCTTALKIDPKSAKALFRRAQARVELDRLGDAAADLREARQLAPSDQSILKLQAQVADSLELKKQEKLNHLAQVKSGKYIEPDGQPPKRRRVPIKIVEAPEDGEGSTVKGKEVKVRGGEEDGEGGSGLKAVSTRSLNGGSTAKPESDQAKEKEKDKPKSFKEAKEARDTARPSRVGGGIFTRTGASKVFPTREATPPAKSPTPSSSGVDSSVTKEEKPPSPAPPSTAQDTSQNESEPPTTPSESAAKPIPKLTKPPLHPPRPPQTLVLTLHARSALVHPPHPPSTYAPLPPPNLPRTALPRVPLEHVQRYPRDGRFGDADCCQGVYGGVAVV
ncbi:phosphoprotein phosphatase [Coprinopsis cinerea AmutBmut pab1-1]|nr:phosphoprotein phosphatase [Coprinopsis cinerea AmutBmut pab1-1]